MPANQLLAMPTDLKDAAQLKPIMQKLGLPESPDKYQFEIKPDSAKGHRDFINDDSAKELKASLLGSLHESMMPPAAVGATMNALNAWLNNNEQSWITTQQQAQEQKMADLKKEWGGAYEERLEMSRRAGRELGMSGEMMDAIETVVGADGLLRHLHATMEKIGVEKFADSGAGGTQAPMFGTTVDQIETELSKLDAEIGSPKNRKRFEEVAARRGPDFERRQQLLARRAELLNKEEKANV